MASIIKVDTIQDQDGNNIISEAANTITIGASGDTITIPSGATLANSGIVTGFQSTGIDDNATSTAITIDSNENVGIGISSPTRPLTYYHSTAPYFALQNATTGTSITDGMLIGIGGAYAFIRNQENQPLVFQTDGNNERMRIEANGNVGIGTSSPTQKLDIDTGHINFSNNYGIDWGGNNSVRGSATDNRINFKTNASERMRINSSGDVGIGTTSPQSRLHVRTADSGGSPITAGDELVVEGGAYNIGMSFLSTGGNGQFIYFGDDADNNIGSIKYEHGDDSLQFVTNASEAMRIDSSGNVGIGTSSPSEKLHVNGDIRNQHGVTYPLYLYASSTGNTTGVRTITQIAARCGIIFIKSNHNSYIPFYTRGGAGIAYKIFWGDPDTGFTTGNSFTYSESGTGANTYTINMSSGGGTLTTERTSGSATYDVYVFRWNLG